MDLFYCTILPGWGNGEPIGEPAGNGGAIGGNWGIAGAAGFAMAVSKEFFLKIQLMSCKKLQMINLAPAKPLRRGSVEVSSR